MAILNNSNAISSGGYDINNSLRFRSSASAYLNRTPASAGNRKTWTWSAWVKRGTLGAFQTLFCAGSTDAVSPYETRFRFNDTDTLSLAINGNGATGGSATTSAVFRDPSAWYHIVGYVDMAATGQANKVRIYVNGVLQTVTYTSLTTTDDTQVNNNVIHRISANSFALSGYFDGYMAEQYLIDGQALTPSSFGETDTTTGSWKPKAYTGTYGTNGFYLKFSDIATTSGSNAGLGKDFSGNANYWTTNNISVTAGTTYDAMIDSPTLTSATVANYPVFNPINKGLVTISNANLTLSVSASNWQSVFASMALPSTGKWYWEVTCVTSAGANYQVIGISDMTDAVLGTFVGGTANSYGYLSDGTKVNNGAGTAYGSSWTTGDVIGVAVDATAGTIAFYKNNTAQGTAYSGLSSSRVYAPACGIYQSGPVLATNFGQRPFSYTPPTGFVALNTFNLPDSTIKKGNTVMDATLYTGNGADNRTISGLNFTPGLVWMKDRSNAYSHILIDAVRGNGKYVRSNGTDQENWAGNIFPNSGPTTNGFIVDGVSNVSINANGDSYVGWTWVASGSGSSNTSGSITSTVSVNTTAGFSIVRYSGNATSGATVGHGLGVAPKMVIAKTLNTAGYDWPVYHSSLTSSSYVVYLNLTSAQSISTNKFNGVAPSSTVVTLGDHGTNLSGTNNQVLYCWAEIAGFSKFGSYTGNASTDGPFIYLGFRPKFVMAKMSSGISNWYIRDTSRDTSNTAFRVLYPDTTDVEGSDTTFGFDLLSNGFKVRSSANGANQSGQTFIYAAFAENPFKNSNAK